MKAVVVASSDNAYVRAVARGIVERGHPLALVLIGSRAENLLFKLNSLRRIRDRLGWREVLARLRDRKTEVYEGSTGPSMREIAAAAGARVVEYDQVNGGAVLAELSEIDGAIVVLAGCGLVDSAFIAAARGRCLNGHPALLPGLRGVDVVDWALHEQVPLGVTAHWVEPSVDAGGILVTRPLAPEVGESALAFRRRIVATQAEALAEAFDLAATGRDTAVAHDLSRSTLRFAAPRAVRESARRRFDELTRPPAP